MNEQPRRRFSGGFIGRRMHARAFVAANVVGMLLQTATSLRLGPPIRSSPTSSSWPSSSLSTSRISHSRAAMPFIRNHEGSQQRRDISCNLFFRSGQRAAAQSRRPSKPPKWVVDDLTAGVTFPFQFPLESSDPAVPDLVATIRCMTPDDLSQILPMCVEEFGTDYSASTSAIQTIAQWWEQTSFNFLLTTSIRAKMSANQHRAYHHDPRSNNGLLSDPALMVLTVREEVEQDDDADCEKGESKSNNKETVPAKAKISSRTVRPKPKGKPAERIVAFAELSLQPVEANENPPPIPVPRRVKELYCVANNLPALQGWVTNVLVDTEERGKGYSKILMYALEGIARSWREAATIDNECTCIYLHADADMVSGRVSQGLYEGMGYVALKNADGANSQFSWMLDVGSASTMSKIHDVEGVPLLFFRKEL